MRTRAALQTKSKSVKARSANAPGRPFRAILLGAAGVAAAFAVLPPVAYRSEAVIGVGSSTTPLREAMTEAAAATAVSKPVISRAAASLNGTQIAAPQPSILDKLWVTVGLDHATAADARLADTLAAEVAARTGDVPGVIKISAVSSQASAAAKIATTVAEALIDEQDVQAIDARHERESDLSKTIEGLKTNAAAAHRRLASLGGGAETDPVQALANAAAQTAAAQARLDVVRGILSSGTPPVSDRRDLPQNVATLQAAYLDLSQQLSKAHETLGDKHTTVVSLQSGVKNAAANLTAEWKRLSKVAEADVAAARDRQTALSKSVAPADPKKKAMLDDARRNVTIADEALARAQKAGADAPAEDNPYRLVAPAPVPTQAMGLALQWRLALSLLAGIAAFCLARLRPRLASLLKRALSVKAPAAVAGASPTNRRFFEDEDSPVGSHSVGPSENRGPVLEMPASSRRAPDLDEDGYPDLEELMPALGAIEAQGELPIVLVGSNEEAEATTPLALALSQAAAVEGHRVLLVEALSLEGALAASADAGADPVLLDIFGRLRVAMPAAVDEGFLFVAPGLRNNDRIVQSLARSGEVSLLEDISAEFDLVIVDGGQVLQSVDLIPPADAFLRVGRYPSKRDDNRFLATCGASAEAFLGTITASSFIPRDETPAPPADATRRSSERSSVVTRAARPTGGVVVELPLARRRAASR